MLRNLFVRLFRCFVVLIGIAILSVCIAGYFAFQQPAFYADLRAQKFSQRDALAVKTSFQRMELDLKLWSERSISLQRAQRSATATPKRAIPGASRSKYDPTQDTHSITITEQQLNAQLASGKTKISRELRNPRVRIAPDHIDLGIEFVTPKASCVLSTKLKLAPISQGRLRLEIVSARIGQLPLPLNTILRCLPREVIHSGGDLELNLTSPTPHLCLNVSGQGPTAPAVKSIKCLDGEMTIEFLAPVFRIAKL